MHISLTFSFSHNLGTARQTKTKSSRYFGFVLTTFSKNKDDNGNIYKSEAVKLYDN